MKVLIPIDGSDTSLRTLAWACELLNTSSTEFHLLHVIPREIPELVTPTYEIEDTLKMLKKAEAMISENGGQLGSSKYIEGSPVPSICDYAKEINADQILMGSHGRSGLLKVLLGSVSSGVLEKSETPVFIYKNLNKKLAQV